ADAASRRVAAHLAQVREARRRLEEGEQAGPALYLAARRNAVAGLAQPLPDPARPAPPPPRARDAGPAAPAAPAGARLLPVARLPPVLADLDQLITETFLLAANTPMAVGAGWVVLDPEWAEVLALFGPGAPGAPLVDLEVAGLANRRLGELVATRQAAAREAPTPAAAAATYVGLATQATSDAQNVHDVSVLAFQAAVVRRLEADQALLDLPDLAAVRAWLDAEGASLSEGRPGRLEDVRSVVERVGQETRVVALGTTDAECLRRVWLRTSDPRNAERRAALRQALFDGLADAWEEKPGQARQIVCVNGRVSRILGALVLLDWDERNWETCRLEQLKADIFRRALGVIAAEAERAAGSADPAARLAGRALLARTPEEFAAVGPVPEDAETALAARTREAIGADVDAFVRELEARGAGKAIPPHLLEAVKTEAQAAVV
ncbi:MAG TPA: hypothetical protein VNI01_08840, partial [Elusimicrobiota bacterium]|nr:hypothetical protein [Elusimicrobiota bacterium]